MTRHEERATPPEADTERFGFSRDEHGGVTLLIGGHPQSYVDVADPEHLVFEYMAQIAAVLDALAPRPHPIGVTHVGGAALTLPRWVHHTRPGSPQIVLEPDAALTEVVRREVPLPRGHRIRVRPVDGRSGLTALKPGSADVIIIDAYADGAVPAELQTLEFLRDGARVVRDGGLWLMNLADEPGLRHVLRVAAGARDAFGHVSLVGMHEVLKGRRFGNVVLVASGAPLDIDEIRRHVARLAVPTGVWDEREVTRRISGRSAITDVDAVPSPTAPEAGRWRVR
ncbi:spermidine synthase [Kribbia dieselivorans]|uniref:spermidine synthase n=1 Tax=Kribbia dieselivorans TaxID=331526 RepID=UPI000A746B3E|nr:fused MFS/spermidine synthase [Kribbia dieselivorans]